MSHPPQSTKIRRNGTDILTYELPHRIRSTHLYPLLSPNRSTITLHGSNDGVFITWRGGRRLKPSPSGKTPNLTVTNGAVDSDVVMIDSDEEATPQDDAPVEFEDSDDLEEQSSIIAMTRIDLESPVDVISVAPLPRSSSGGLIQSAPKSCAEFIYFAVATRDSKVRLIRTPLVPTRKSSLNEAAGDYESRTVHANTANHGVQPQTRQLLALTLATHHAHVYDDDAIHGAAWDWAIAHYTSTPSPRLTALRLPESAFGRKAGAHDNKRTYSLSNQLTAISFNPSRHPGRHTQLLVADVLGVVRICEVVSDGHPQEARPQLPRNIVWLTSLYVPFMDLDSPLAKCSAGAQRKRVLGADWALDGRSIVVLLGDGTWGLWDLEGVGPDSTSAAASRVSRGSPVMGGGVTFFTLHGSLVPRSTARQPPETKVVPSPQATDHSKLAPMTPNTRKAKQATLFSETVQPRFSLSKPTETASMPRGGLSVSNASTATGTLPYDSIIFWYHEVVYAVPNLMLYWSKALSASPSPTRSSVQGTDAQKLESLSSGGEAISSIVHLPPASPVSSAPQQQRLYHNLLLAAEHRHVLYSPPRPAHVSTRTSLPKRPTERVEIARNADQQLLSRGALDLGGLDRMMDDMAEHPPAKQTKLNIFGEPEKMRRVGFKSSR